MIGVSADEGLDGTVHALKKTCVRPAALQQAVAACTYGLGLKSQERSEIQFRLVKQTAGVVEVCDEQMP